MRKSHVVPVGVNAEKPVCGLANCVLLRAFLLLLISSLLFSSCASGPQGLPTGQMVKCEDGDRQLIDCSMAFEQFARTFRFDVGIVREAAVGVGLGAQSLINLDSITADLLVHQRQICVDYNNCMLSGDEYKEEIKYVRRAQMKVREASASVQSMFGFPPGGLASLPRDHGIDPGRVDDSAEMDESKRSVYRGLDQLNAELARLGEAKKAGREKPPQPAAAPVKLEYAVYKEGKAKEKVKISPGAVLKEGDKVKFSFMADREGYVYIVNFDPLGNANIIFPHPNVSMDNTVKPAKIYEMPTDDWYWLDQAKGKEIVYLIASPEKIGNLDGLINELTAGDKDKKKKMHELRLKGSLDGLIEVMEKQIREPRSSQPSEEATAKYGTTAIKIEFSHE